MSTRRLHAAAAAAAATIVLMIPALGLVHAATASRPPSSPRREPSSRPLAPIPIPSATDRVVVRTVSVPGGMSAAMQEALTKAGALFAPSAREVVVTFSDGTTMVSSTSRFLHVAVTKTDADGEVRTRCVSTLDEALRDLGSNYTPAVGAEKE